MNTKKYSYLLILFIFFLAHSAHAKSSVWRVVKGDNQLFIGGTVHILSPSDYPLPSEFEEAYIRSVKLVTETDIQEMQDPEFQKVMLSKVLYSDGRNLRMDISEATFHELERHLSERGIPIANLMNFKPGMVAMTLTVLELKRLGIDIKGVDEFFLLRALNDRKELGELETAYQQLDFLTKMLDGKEDEVIAHTLREIQELPGIMQTLMDAWRRGDNDKLEEIAAAPFKSDYPELYDELVLKRNNAWVPKIEAMLQTKEVEFILVGVLHLVGDDSVLEQLKAKGYEVQQP